MAVPLSRRVKHRFLQRLAPEDFALAALVEAIQALLQVTSREDPQFLAHGLELLVRHMGADQALLVTVEGGNCQTQWWLPDGPDDDPPARAESLCQWLLENPHRTLVLRDIPKDVRWKDDVELKALGFQAAAGITLQVTGQLKGLVFLHYRHPYAFSRAELALLAAVASYLGRILEIENLKAALGELENTLAITRAVVEDSTIQDPFTDLPNLRYLEIWLKANLVAASRDQSAITVAYWQLDTRSPDGVRRIREVAERIRGGDLMVSLGPGLFLLVLQHTPKGLGQVFLSRLRQRLGPVPMGATLWLPGLDDNRFDSVLRRLEAAVAESQSRPGHDLVWRIPELENGG